MGNRVPPSFNTVKHSNRDKREKKQQQQRVLLLGMIVVLVLLVVTLLTFAVCAIVDAVQKDSPAGNIEYQEATKFSTDIETGPLVIINSHYGIESVPVSSFVTLTPQDIPNVGGSPVYAISKNLQLHADTQTALNAMMTEYYNIYGTEDLVTVTDAYRPISTSNGIGISDHNSGYLIALEETVSASRVPEHWIFKNCHKYGFVLRYPEDKQSHTQIGSSYNYDYTEAIRYVGVPHATYMKQNNLCLEEYVQKLQTSATKDTPLQITGADEKLYSVYYVAAAEGQLTQFHVPSNYSYEISGDNIGGFIITVNLSDPRT